MARRGDDLRQHILAVAKDVFLDMGFERASMDVIAAKAETSKRSLYAHFQTKEKLFLAVADRIHELFLGRLRTPRDYADDRVEAITLYCAHFHALLLWEPILRTCRMAIAESDRMPEASRRLFDTFFVATRDRLASFLSPAVADGTAVTVANRLIGATIYPSLAEALFLSRALTTQPPEPNGLAQDPSTVSIRSLVADTLGCAAG